MPTSTTPRAAGSRALTLAANSAFVPIGFATILLSPMLPILSARWSLNDTQAGTLFTAQFLASTFAVALSGVLVARWGFRFAINAGLFAMAAGVAALPFTSHWLGFGCIAAYGFGSGLAVPAANLLVAEVNPHRRSAALNLLNFSWSLGAVSCPFLVSAAVVAHMIPLLLVTVGGFMLLVLVGIAATSGRTVEPVAADRDPKNPLSIDWSARPLYILAVLFFLYVGAENAYGGWTAAFAKSLGTLRPSVAVMTPSFFYISLMLGRWIAPLVLRRVDDVLLARAGIVLACAGMAGLLAAHSMTGIAISVSAAGFGLASVYPITIALLSREFGSAASRVGSIMFTMSNLGGSCLPFLVGFCSTRFHNLRVGLAVPLVASGLMFVLYRTKWKPAHA
jgi:MFS transporter, FHS family, glucose/mannose:H+ symporter